MPADVLIESITSDRFSFEHGKILHLCLKPGANSEKIILKIDGMEFYTSNLKFECHANLLRVRLDHSVDHQRFELLLPRHSFAEIEITETAFNMLTTAIIENSSRYEEEQREARRALFMNNLENKKP
jgi:hypothetical protein